MGKTSAGTDVLRTARLVLRPLQELDLDALASQLGFQRLISLIHPDNVASQAVATRIGMRHERDLVFEGRPTSLFSCNIGGADPDVAHARAAVLTRLGPSSSHSARSRLLSGVTTSDDPARNNGV